MPQRSNNNYKTIRNLIKTIGSIKFEVRPKNNKDGDGFVFNFIEIVDENTCQFSFTQKLEHYLHLSPHF